MSKSTQPNNETMTTLELEILTSEKRLESVVRSHTALIKVTLAFAVIALLTVISLCFVVIKFSPKNRYFASTSDGRIVKLTPLSEPMLSLQAVEDFAGRAISNTFTFDYANYKTQITQNSPSFTAEAFSQIKKNLEAEQGIAQEAVKNSWAVTANVIAAPTVAMQGKMPNGRYGWRLIFPVRMTFQSETTVRTARYTVDVIVVREKQKNNPKGIVISNLNLSAGYNND